MSPVNLEDYIPVNERLTAFYARHPEGSIQSELVELTDKRVVMRAYAYRTPEDTRPGIGYSSMNIPGSTSFTRGSEVENTETSAWGRAIAALGFEVKRGIATAEEVANKAQEKPVTGDAAKRPSELRREREAAAVPVSEAKPEQAVADGPWSEGALTVEGAIYLNATAGLDGEVRHSPDGPRLGFGLALDGTRKIPQVVALGDLAIDIHDAIGNDGKRLHGTKATVSGELLRVPWTKNGKAMPPFQRLMLARIETPDWTLPAPEPVIPEGQESLALGTP